MRTRQSQSPYARLIPLVDGLAFECSYDPQLVAEMKIRIPYDARRWDPAAKRWIVDPQYGQTCADLACRYLRIKVTVPQVSATRRTDTRLIRLEYLAACKDRDGTSAAFGWVDGGWSVIFPEAVLRDWFSAGDVDTSATTPSEQPTFYATLGVPKNGTLDDIKRAYRRLARQWHPDVCREPGASTQFIAIQRAYEVLSDPLQRRKYDAGLALQASLSNKASSHSYLSNAYRSATTGYRSPLRCGWVLAEGVEYLGRFNVSKILQWEDITDDQGRTMVTSWPQGAETFEVTWV